MPAILGEQAHILVAGKKRVQLALVVLAGHSDQEIREVHSGFCSGKNKTAIELSDRVSIPLGGMKLCSELHVVVANHFGKRFGGLVGVVHLQQLVRRSAGRETVEVQVLYTLSSRIESHNTGRAVGIRKPLGYQAYILAANSLPEIGVIAH